MKRSLFYDYCTKIIKERCFIKTSIFALLDCNNFYASCERLFNPKIEGKPVVVLSNNDGCVVARSQEAKDLKIKMGVPYFQIKDFCTFHKVHIYSSNYQLYGDLSRRVMELLLETGFEVEVYSIDEAFIKFPAAMLIEEAEEICVALKKKVKKWVGIPTAMGLAPTKTLAKVANYKAKRTPQGIFNLYHSHIADQILENFPIEEVWGVGKANFQKLSGLGIRTAKQFIQQEPSLIRHLMGVIGERMLWELRGLSCLEIEEVSPDKQSITCSRSFGKRVTDLEEICEALATFANTACISLREQESFTQGICVFLESILDTQTSKRRYYSSGSVFPMATQDTSIVITEAKRCLKKIYSKREIYKKCGIILLDLIKEEEIPLDLFHEKPSEKRTNLIRAFDEINSHFGKGALFYAAMGTKSEWKMRSNKLSRHFTTDWNQLAIAKT